MTTFYAEIVFSVVSFETDPSEDINADAKVWTPQNDVWVDRLGSTGIGADVHWGNDYREIPESAVPEMQRRCREFMHKGDGRPPTL
jgi:hypothetical protein